MEDASAEPPTKINPYKTLNIRKKASAAEVKTAYKKLALQYHPDKVPPSERQTAHTKFQDIAFAYAILSDPTRRDRYDTTGSTSESISDDFNWASFYKAQYAESVTVDKIKEMKNSYQGSDEEKRDVLKAYMQFQGNLNKVFREILLSNALDDEARFREYIDGAIAAGEVEGFPAYVKETKEGKDKRKKKAEKEHAEAKQHAKDIGIYESVFGNGGEEGGEKNGLADLIQQRQKQRAATFMDDLEAKYGGKKALNGKVNGKTNGKKRKSTEDPPKEEHKTNGARQKRRKAATVIDESNDEDEEDHSKEGPSEEAFQAMAARGQRSQKVKPAVEDSDAEVSLGEDDSEEESEEDQDEGAESESEEELPKPAQKAKGRPQAQKEGSKTKAKRGRK